MTTRVMLILVAFLILPSLLSAATKKTAVTAQLKPSISENYAGIHGWSNTKWGMTIEEVKKLYPQATESQIESSKYLTVNFKINIFDCKAKLAFNKDNNKTNYLSNVRLEVVGNINTGTFLKLEELLTLKYGMKTWSGLESSDFIMRFSSWHLKSTNIQLLYQKGSYVSYIAIEYSPTSVLAEQVDLL